MAHVPWTGRQPETRTQPHSANHNWALATPAHFAELYHSVMNSSTQLSDVCHTLSNSTTTYWALPQCTNTWALSCHTPQPLNSTLPHLLIGPPATDSELKSKRHLTFSNRYRSLSSHYTLLSGEGHRPKSNRLPSRGEMSRSLSTYPRVSSDKTSFVRNKSHCQILIITM